MSQKFSRLELCQARAFSLVEEQKAEEKNQKNRSKWVKSGSLPEDLSKSEGKSGTWF